MDNRGLHHMSAKACQITAKSPVCSTCSDLQNKEIVNGPKGGDRVPTERGVMRKHFLYVTLSWWRHRLETFSALLAICAGNSPVTGEFQRPVMRSFDVSLIWVSINGWVNKGEAGDLRRHRAHYDVTVMSWNISNIFRTIWTQFGVDLFCYSCICCFVFFVWFTYRHCPGFLHVNYREVSKLRDLV